MTDVIFKYLFLFVGVLGFIQALHFYNQDIIWWPSVVIGLSCLFISYHSQELN